MRILSLILMIGLLLVTAACNDTFVDPFDNEGRFFTIYGFLDVLETEHAVRVVPLRRTPEHITSPTEANADIDATVTSTDLTTGETIIWQHRLEKLSDETYAHIFRAAFLVQPGRRYRLEVKRSDGATATAETKVPFISDAARFSLDPVQITPDSVVTQEVYLEGVASPWNIEALYLMGNETGANSPFTPLQSRFYVPYGRSGEPTDDGGWHVRLTISEDQAQVRAEIDAFRSQGIYDDSPLLLRSMGVRIRILDANWDPPEGVFDPEVLAQPGRLSNVENGHGFWGSVGLYTQEWNVSLDFSRLLGYKGGG